ncbi:hypothetical protein FE257_001859 [Aspergillus nanangensis]|uniref:Mitochondrial import inner membrane translocase subunit TIM50 n=1 Tax=Aspergillus nanangensis TaxID=2582783 RepID=A0AAD4CDC6_ASPNN|nr:hypothetical protein FE257_001859 [Aspergillus nanangensis]
MESQGTPRDTPSSAEDRPRASWRPYQSRWPAKSPASRQPTSQPPENNKPANPRKARKSRNPKPPKRNLNPQAQPYNGYQGGSQPTPDGHGLSYPQNGFNPTSSPYGNQSNMPNPSLQLFPGIPGAPETNNFPAFSPQFFNPDPSLVPQLQNLQSTNQHDMNQPTNMPSWNDMNNFMNFLPQFPPPFMMNFGLQSLQPSAPMLNNFPSFPFDPMAMTAAGPAGAISPVKPSLKNANRERERGSVPPEPPTPTQSYMKQSSEPPKKLLHPRPLLVILDLNGTLIYRKHRRIPPVFARRTGLEIFLETLMQNYSVMIWSSSQPETVRAVCEKLFPGNKREKLVAEWGRDKFNLTKSQYRAKIQVYKTLNTVWANPEIQASYPDTRASRKRQRGKNGASDSSSMPQWDQTNTILIDDSKLKAASEPYNILEIPEFSNQPDVDESAIFPKVLQCLEALSKHDDVSKVLHQWNSQATPGSSSNIFDLRLDAMAETADAAQTRKDRRKARKQERKALRREQKATTGTTDLEAGGKKPKPKTLSENSHAAAVPEPTAKEEPGSARSPSPVSSVGSENYLLDRLEESLNVKQD